MMYKTFYEVLDAYGNKDQEFWYDLHYLSEGKIEVGIVKTGEGYNVWNIHPLRKGWQKVYTLESCNPQEQCVQSIQSLKRLFEKE